MGQPEKRKQCCEVALLTHSPQTATASAAKPGRKSGPNNRPGRGKR